jgi:hypothetical protein
MAQELFTADWWRRHRATLGYGFAGAVVYWGVVVPWAIGTAWRLATPPPAVAEIEPPPFPVTSEDPAPQRISSRDAPYHDITVEDLGIAVATNEILVEKLFSLRAIRTAGRVVKVLRHDDGRPMILLQSSNGIIVRCVFAEPDSDRLATVLPTQMIVVQGFLARTDSRQIVDIHDPFIVE